MQQRLKKLIIYRLILTTVTFLMGLLFQLQGIAAMWGPYGLFYFLIFLFYTSTIIFALLMRKVKDFTVLIYAQTTADALIITGIIYITGGGSSVFFSALHLGGPAGGGHIGKKGRAHGSHSLQHLLWAPPQYGIPLGDPLPLPSPPL
jgi:magnesium-transporting ATPase (P-type)